MWSHTQLLLRISCQTKKWTVRTILQSHWFGLYQFPASVLTRLPGLEMSCEDPLQVPGVQARLGPGTDEQGANMWNRSEWFRWWRVLSRNKEKEASTRQEIKKIWSSPLHVQKAWAQQQSICEICEMPNVPCVSKKTQCFLRYHKWLDFCEIGSPV